MSNAHFWSAPVTSPSRIWLDTTLRLLGNGFLQCSTDSRHFPCFSCLTVSQVFTHHSAFGGSTAWGRILKNQRSEIYKQASHPAWALSKALVAIVEVEICKLKEWFIHWFSSSFHTALQSEVAAVGRSCSRGADSFDASWQAALQCMLPSRTSKLCSLANCT